MDMLTPEPLVNERVPTLDDSDTSDEETMDMPVINWHRDSYGMNSSPRSARIA